MKYEELLEKYQASLIENNNLKKEIEELKERLDSAKAQPCVEEYQAVFDFYETSYSVIDKFSDSREKIRLFMSLFRGRDDAYAARWENPKKGTSGYSPFCVNEWKPGLCRKPKEKCTNCPNKQYPALNEKIIEDHLRGTDNFVAGIYPLCLDETCYFLAIDFDGKEWAQDIAVLREVCLEFHIPLAWNGPVPVRGPMPGFSSKVLYPLL